MLEIERILRSLNKRACNTTQKEVGNETPKTRTLSARTPTSLVLQLDKVEDR
jgi:hypothetical protein